MGGMALAGWIIGNEPMKGLGGSITMKANTAIGLMANGLALVVMVWLPPRLKPLAGALAVLGATIGGLTLSQHLVGWDLGIDELLFAEPPGARATTSPGRMGPNGATGLLLTGLAIVWMRRRDSASSGWAQGMACAVMLLAAIPVAGYLYGAEQLYSVARYTGIALPTALSLLSLSVGILAAGHDGSLIATLSSAGPGGVLARRLLMPAIVLPVSLGYVRIRGEQAGLYDTGLGTALFAIALAALFVTLIWRTALQLNTIDADRRRAEDERARLLEREHQARVAVEHANRLKDHFLATLSHELRTPLNAILGYARMFRNGLIPTEKQAHAVEVIERNAVAQNQLIEELLDMSRMTTGRIRLARETLRVATPLQEAIESVRPMIEAKQIDLHVDLDPLAGSVHGDEGRLRQVFWNLLTNAVKFTPDRGTIRVSVEAEPEAITVAVRDNGIGIDPAFLPQVFEPFRQADIGAGRRYGGLGLGLAICRQLVELHGGQIAARSDGLGCGATVTVRLPRHGPDAKMPPAAPGLASALAPATAARELLAGLDVLAVDDERDSLELVQYLLENCGADVRTAPDAADALRALGERVPDLLVADIGLPGMDGCELLREVRARTGRHVPAIAVTAFARADDRRRTRVAGFQDHIAKPIDPVGFIETVAAAVQAGRLRQQRT